MLSGNMKEAQEKKIVMKDVEEGIVDQFLSFLVSNSVELDAYNAFDLYQIADLYQQEDLKSQSLEVISKHLNEYDMVDCLELAVQWSSELKSTIEKQIKYSKHRTMSSYLFEAVDRGLGFALFGFLDMSKHSKKEILVLKREGKSLLQTIGETGNLKMMKTALDFASSAKLWDKTGFLALIESNTDLGILNLWIQYRASLSPSSVDDIMLREPLIKVFTLDRIDIAKALVNAGANPQQCFINSKSLIDIATETNRAEWVHVFSKNK